jgi:hypothetical protein
MGRHPASQAQIREHLPVLTVGHVLEFDDVRFP